MPGQRTRLPCQSQFGVQHLLDQFHLCEHGPVIARQWAKVVACDHRCPNYPEVVSNEDVIDLFGRLQLSEAVEGARSVSIKCRYETMIEHLPNGSGIERGVEVAKHDLRDREVQPTQELCRALVSAGFRSVIEVNAGDVEPRSTFGHQRDRGCDSGQGGTLQACTGLVWCSPKPASPGLSDRSETVVDEYW